MQGELGQIFGLRGIFCRSESMVRVRTSFCYLLHLVFSIRAAEISRLGARVTAYDLWKEYCGLDGLIAERWEREFVYIWMMLRKCSFYQLNCGCSTSAKKATYDSALVVVKSLSKYANDKIHPPRESTAAINEYIAKGRIIR